MYKGVEYNSAILVLEDGKEFFGNFIGKTDEAFGEICFSTAMLGYQHTITDPSFAGQIIVFTFPNIGNIGINIHDNERSKIFAKGVVFRSCSKFFAHEDGIQSLSDWLIEHDITGIEDIDTRELTQYIQAKGPQNGIIKHVTSKSVCADYSLDMLAIMREVITYKHIARATPQDNSKGRVVIVDFGVKDSIINIVQSKFDVVIVSGVEGFDEVCLSYSPNGVVLSNGPGNPALIANYTNAGIHRLIDSGIPILGICLGHQLIALALGIRTDKMLSGHRGVNHPVRAQNEKRVSITTQNHGFVVLGEDVQNNNNCALTYISNFDGSVEGLSLNNGVVNSIQFHPEGSPGTHDMRYIFDDFFSRVEGAV